MPEIRGLDKLLFHAGNPKTLSLLLLFSSLPSLLLQSCMSLALLLLLLGDEGDSNRCRALSDEKFGAITCDIYVASHRKMLPSVSCFINMPSGFRRPRLNVQGRNNLLGFHSPDSRFNQGDFTRRGAVTQRPRTELDGEFN